MCTLKAPCQGCLAAPVPRRPNAGTKLPNPASTLLSSIRLYVPAALSAPGRAVPFVTREEVRAMEGARAPKFRPYWVRYLVAFSAREKFKWARDNVLIACLCSLAPGLIAAGVGAAL